MHETMLETIEDLDHKIKELEGQLAAATQSLETQDEVHANQIKRLQAAIVDINTQVTTPGIDPEAAMRAVQHIVGAALQQDCAYADYPHPLPKEPPPGLLMSMAIRYDHGLGCPGFYDQFKFNDVSHAQKLSSTLSDMRKLYEEVSGFGFYSTEKENEYAAMYDMGLRKHTPENG